MCLPSVARVVRRRRSLRLDRGHPHFHRKPKPLYFAEHREEFAEFADKIVHVVVDDMGLDPDPWKNEAFQRNAMLRASTTLI